MFGQLPMERVTPDIVFDKVGLTMLDHSTEAHSREGMCHSALRTIVSNLTTEAFIACLRRFIARHGKPALIWSNHGSNFVGATRELKELFDFHSSQKTHGTMHFLFLFYAEDHLEFYP